MKPASLLLLIAFASVARPQPSPAYDQVTSKEFLRQLLQDGVYNFISAKVAESMLTQRVEPVMKQGDMVGRVSGTVIVAFEIGRHGEVLHAMAVSGPALLKPPVIAAARKWKFKPYTVKGEAQSVATSIPIKASNF